MEYARSHTKSKESYKLFYEEQALDPRLTNIRKPPRRQIIFKTIKAIVNNIESPAPVLDIGCQHGIMELALASLWYDVTAIDVSETYVKKSMDNTKVFNEYINYKVTAVEDIHTVFNNTFSVVVCNSVLEHVSDFRIAWESINSVVKKGTLGVFTVPLYNSWLAEEHTRVFTDDNILTYFPKTSNIEKVYFDKSNPSALGWYFITMVW